MKHQRLFVLFVLLLATAALISACGSNTNSTAVAQSSQSSTVNYSGGTVVAEGRVMPKDSANLFFMTGGKVDEVLVHEGDSVTKGQVLARLSDRESVEANVAAAQVEVESAQQTFDDLGRTAEVAYNQAVLDEITAEKAYYDALLAWDDFDQDKYDDDLDKAKSDVAAAKSDLEDAQDEFNKYASLDKNNSDRKRTKNELDSAQKKYDQALSDQAKIENDYRQLKSELDFAQANLDEARRTRQNREDGADKDQLALAQSRLDSANAQLKAAETALNNLDIVSPYDGIVARVDISTGEMVNPSQVVMVVADTSEWVVETTDLTENDIVDINKGFDVVVVPDALPALELKGKVESIADYYVEKSGDITYKVRVKLIDTDPRLKWGMTTETRFSEPSQ